MGCGWCDANDGTIYQVVRPRMFNPMILKNILESTKLDANFCADLLGVATDQFNEWLTGVRPLPRFLLPEISSILGVSEKMLISLPAGSGKSASLASAALAPAIWYKLRDTKLVSADRELVALIRKLGFFMDQLAIVRGEKLRRFEPIFCGIHDKVNRTLPPAVQGKAAASEFRSMTDLAHGQSGIGEWIRPTLRKLGVLVVESPIKSNVEGCAFSVGSDSGATPCVFANSYKSTWFRRNAVILHEIGHAIFDLESDQVSIDYKDEASDELKELRAQTFAQECLVPQSVLVQISNRFGIKWDGLAAADLAQLMAYSHAEQRLILKAAYDAEFIDAEQFERYSGIDCLAELRSLTTHALNTREYLRTQALEMPKWIAENRNTELGRRSLRLPSLYVSQVLNAWADQQISEGKAAEMLMVDRDTFRVRFSSIVKGTQKAA
jgi:Zn-dependent peptidase ImmA (M78 family)